MKLVAIAAAALALSAPALVHAQSLSNSTSVSNEDRAPVISVPMRDLDLTQHRGAVQMVQRLESASLEACGASDYSLTEYKAAVRDSECYRATMQQGVAATGSPVVASVYNHRPEVTVGSR